jgi:4-hydroxy-4-methyl-2-oxoglutarate aldolase
MITPAQLEELRDFDTPLLANTIGYISQTPPHQYYLSGEIQSVTQPLGPTVGIAFTAEIDSSTPGETGDTELYWQLLDMMRQQPRPCLLVAKAVGSRPEHECMIGDGMAKTLFSVGCIGLVSDSRVRDVAGLLSTPFAAYCRGRAVHHEALRFRFINRPVEIGGVIISAGFTRIKTASFAFHQTALTSSQPMRSRTALLSRKHTASSAARMFPPQKSALTFSHSSRSMASMIV